MSENIKDMTPKLVKDLGLRFIPRGDRRRTYGLFECQYCGGEFECITNSVNTGNTKSCGCQKINTLGITHGLKSNRFYNTWKLMIQRCTNLKSKVYNYYGGRGITVCEEWLDVRNFVAWGESTHPNTEGYTLDRIDVDGNYEPSNCRWADRTTQNINQRMKKNNTSGFVGVSWSKTHQFWVSYIYLNKKRYNVGTFKDKIEAVLARDNYIIENNLPHKLSTEYKKETK